MHVLLLCMVSTAMVPIRADLSPCLHCSAAHTAPLLLSRSSGGTQNCQFACGTRHRAQLGRGAIRASLQYRTTTPQICSQASGARAQLGRSCHHCHRMKSAWLNGTATVTHHPLLHFFVVGGHATKWADHRLHLYLLCSTAGRSGSGNSAGIQNPLHCYVGTRFRDCVQCGVRARNRPGT